MTSEDVKRDSAPEARARLRVLRFLANGAARLEAGAHPGTVLLDGGALGRIGAAAATIETMAREDLLLRMGKAIVLSEAGLAHLRRVLAADPDTDAFQEQHRDLGEIRVVLQGSVATATVNHAESPLAQMARRKGKDGKPFLSEGEWRAGERLRADYTRGQIMPRLGANWVSAVASGRRQGGAVDLTDAALAARIRVDNAVKAIGPELSGVLIDVCCFLKGLEMVEAERGWPVRSAKIVLKAALGALGRHYDPRPGGRRGGAGSPLHWGADGYRPTITPSSGR